MLTRISLAAAVFAFAGCTTTSAYDMPIPAHLANGNRGYAMTGFAQFTSSEQSARHEVEKKMKEACGGPVTFLRLDLKRADSMAGAPHFSYDAIAECK